MSYLISDIVLILHFCIVIFITLGFVLVPVGYTLNWEWLRNIKIRSLHLGLICLVALETFLGVKCPLTIIEIHLNNLNYSETFIAYWISKVIYWNLPTLFFIVLYAVCVSWTILMWKIFPPRKLWLFFKSTLS